MILGVFSNLGDSMMFWWMLKSSEVKREDEVGSASQGEDSYGLHPHPSRRRWKDPANGKCSHCWIWKEEAWEAIALERQTCWESDEDRREIPLPSQPYLHVLSPYLVLTKGITAMRQSDPSTQSALSRTSGPSKLRIIVSLELEGTIKGFHEGFQLIYWCNSKTYQSKQTFQTFLRSLSTTSINTVQSRALSSINQAFSRQLPMGPQFSMLWTVINRVVDTR